MKFQILLFSLMLTILSCSNKDQAKKEHTASRIEMKGFQAILESAKVNGSILLFDAHQNTYYSNNFKEAKEPYLPASTFKIPNSIIGLELGILQNEQTVFKWDGNARAFSIWEKDLSLKEAFQKSCVPCYQELAREIGAKRMNEYLQKLTFGEMDVTDENIHNFWLVGQSKINPFEQIDFLTRLYNEQLPISKSTVDIIKSIATIKTTENYTLSGKTGLAVSEGKDTGWLVGYIEVEHKVYYFATKIVPNQREMTRADFLPIRRSVTISALRELGILGPNELQ